jgi:hypothetical protein
MKVRDIIVESETHHALTHWRKVGPNQEYEMAYDTHGIGRSAGREVPVRILRSIIAHAFHYGVVKEIPRGSSTYIHDTISKCSVVLERLKSYPFKYIVRSVMSPNEPPPRNNVINIEAPAKKGPLSPDEAYDQMYLHGAKAIAQEKGIDAASQAIASGDDLIRPTLNREQRRAIAKAEKRAKLGR